MMRNNLKTKTEHTNVLNRLQKMFPNSYISHDDCGKEAYYISLYVDNTFFSIQKYGTSYRLTVSFTHNHWNVFRVEKDFKNVNKSLNYIPNLLNTLNQKLQEQINHSNNLIKSITKNLKN